MFLAEEPTVVVLNSRVWNDFQDLDAIAQKVKNVSGFRQVFYWYQHNAHCVFTLAVLLRKEAQSIAFYYNLLSPEVSR